MKVVREGFWVKNVRVKVGGGETEVVKERARETRARRELSVETQKE
jgi:hypothetical protein